MSPVAWPEGPMTALVTPMRADDTVDEEALRLLLDRQVRAGVAAVVVGGGTGEFGTLSVEERLRLADAAAAHLQGRLPLIVQVGALATRDSLVLSRHAEDIGAAALLVASPFGEPISWRERRRFYETVHAETELPIILYNTPPSGIMSLPEVAELAALPRVAAVKDSSGDITLFSDLLDWGARNDFAVYVGIDSLVAFAGANGAHGILVGTSNIVPEAMVHAFRSAREGRRDDTWPALRSFLRFMEQSSNYVGLCKAALALDGLEVGTVRAPYLMPEDAERAALAEHLRALRAATRPAPAPT